MNYTANILRPWEIPNRELFDLIDLCNQMIKMQEAHIDLPTTIRILEIEKDRRFIKGPTPESDELIDKSLRLQREKDDMETDHAKLMGHIIGRLENVDQSLSKIDKLLTGKP